MDELWGREKEDHSLSDTFHSLKDNIRRTIRKITTPDPFEVIAITNEQEKERLGKIERVEKRKKQKADNKVDQKRRQDEARFQNIQSACSIFLTRTGSLAQLDLKEDDEKYFVKCFASHLCNKLANPPSFNLNGADIAIDPKLSKKLADFKIPSHSDLLPSLEGNPIDNYKKRALNITAGAVSLRFITLMVKNNPANPLNDLVKELIAIANAKEEKPAQLNEFYNQFSNIVDENNYYARFKAENDI